MFRKCIEHLEQIKNIYINIYIFRLTSNFKFIFALFISAKFLNKNLHILLF